MDDPPPRIERHEAVDRFGKTVLRTAHDLSAALAENGAGGDDAVVVRTDGPHRSIDGLMALIDEALIDEARDADPPRCGTADGAVRQTDGS